MKIFKIIILGTAAWWPALQPCTNLMPEGQTPPAAMAGFGCGARRSDACSGRRLSEPGGSNPGSGHI